MSDTFTAGSSDVPDVLKTLAGVLPQFTGADLEAQLQTYDAFLTMGVDQFKIAALLAGAAEKTTDARARARIEWAVRNVRVGGRAAAPYDHAEAMADYMKNFTAQIPTAPPDGKRAHPKLLAKLDQIEAEMKKVGFWSATPPPDITGIGNAPTFELWLQCVFLVSTRDGAMNDTLPKESQVGLMAFRQYDYMSSVDAGDLVKLLNEFDELVGLASVGGA